MLKLVRIQERNTKAKAKNMDLDHLAYSAGKFQIDDREYVILVLKGMVEGHDPLPGAAPGFPAAEVGRFVANGRMCAILEADPDTHVTEDRNPADLLTARELQIVILVARGYQTKQIAGQLHISEWTVCTHLRRIFAKLGVDNRAAMVYRCASLISRLE